VSIFLSYRRGQTTDLTHRIADRLKDQFGREEVFVDIDNIPLGEKFPTYIKERIEAKCDVFLTVIGSDWLERDDTTINSDRDFVRIEVRTALKSGVPIIPILAHGTAMPDASQVPSDIVPLLEHNGIRIDSDTFGSQVDKLIRGIEQSLAETEVRRAAEQKRQQEAELVSRVAERQAAAKQRLEEERKRAEMRPGQREPIRCDDSEFACLLRALRVGGVFWIGWTVFGLIGAYGELVHVYPMVAAPSLAAVVCFIGLAAWLWRAKWFRPWAYESTMGSVLAIASLPLSAVVVVLLSGLAFPFDFVLLSCLPGVTTLALGKPGSRNRLGLVLAWPAGWLAVFLLFGFIDMIWGIDMRPSRSYAEFQHQMGLVRGIAAGSTSLVGLVGTTLTAYFVLGNE